MEFRKPEELKMLRDAVVTELKRIGESFATRAVEEGGPLDPRQKQALMAAVGDAFVEVGCEMMHESRLPKPVIRDLVERYVDDDF